MPIPVYTAACLSNERIARDIWEFRLSKPAGFSWKPGQYVLLHIPLVNDPADVQTRAFSIASTMAEADMLFVAKMQEGGRASRWISESLRPGSTVRFQGPFGVFTLHPENPKEYLLIGTSTGIAPFRAHILDALARNDTRRTDLLFGVRSEEDVFWQDMLDAWSRTHAHIHVHTTLSQPSAAWKGHRGRVQEILPRIAPDLSRKQLYACGNPEMTLALKKRALTEWSMRKEDVHVEGYI